MTLSELVSKSLNRLSPELGTDELGSYTAAIVAQDLYREHEGRLVPGNPAAISAARSWLPDAFARGIAQEASERETHPAQRTLAYFRGLGYSSFEEAMGAGIAQASGLTADDVADVDRIVKADNARGEKSRAWILKTFRGHRGGNGT